MERSTGSWPGNYIRIRGGLFFVMRNKPVLIHICLYTHGKGGGWWLNDRTMSLVWCTRMLYDDSICQVTALLQSQCTGIGSNFSGKLLEKERVGRRLYEGMRKNLPRKNDPLLISYSWNLISAQKSSQVMCLLSWNFPRWTYFQIL